MQNKHTEQLPLCGEKHCRGDTFMQREFGGDRMFFIGGVNKGIRVLPYTESILCKFCGSQANCQVVMVYYYFSFFFIPLFKWNRQFLVKMQCCEALYELDAEIGKRILKGEEVRIKNEHLRLIKDGNTRYSARFQHQSPEGSTDESVPLRCPICKQESPGNFNYCPNCGQRLR